MRRGCDPGLTLHGQHGQSITQPFGPGFLRRIGELPNKGMKQTKPAQAMELRSLSPVFSRQRVRATPSKTPLFDG
jgi:hypothetical protein